MGRGSENRGGVGSLTWALLVGACAIGGCGGSGTPPAVAVGSVCEREVQAGPTALRRLTRGEYDRTIRDLLGDDAHVAASFPPDEDGLGYPVGATVSPLLAEHYQRAAEAIAARAVDERLDVLLPCDPSAGEQACARELVVRFGRRAYRRHLEPSRVDALMDVYRAGAAEGGFSDGVRLVLTAMLESPYFIYRVELGGPDGSLSMDERASRLSYFLWGTMPDDALFDAADARALATVAEIEAQARRMLEDPRAHRTVERFATLWLELALGDATKDDAAYAEWSPAVVGSLEASTARFVDHVVFESSGTLRELLSAPYAFVDDRTAPLFGVAAPGSDALVEVTLDPRERIGILTHPAVLAQHARSDESSPILRGHFVRERLFCQPLPPPPDDLMVTAPDPDPSLTTRARYEEHGQNPACVTCHELMDPLGFAFERYDGIGRHRTEDHGQAIDARAEIRGTRETDAAVDGPIELVRVLSESQDVLRCFVEQMWTFAFRRAPAPSDACSLESVRQAFEDSGGDIRELLVAIATSDAFLHAEPIR